VVAVHCRELFGNICQERCYHCPSILQRFSETGLIYQLLSAFYSPL